MVATTICQRASLSVIDYRCSVGPADRPFVELYGRCSVSYVRKGSFGYRYRGESFELVAGAILVGHAGDEYMCTHDHVCGDECLSFQFAPALVETIGDRAEIWRTGSVPPLPELMVLGELAQAAAEGSSDIGLDEASLLFGARFVEVVSGRKRRPPAMRPRDRRRAASAGRPAETARFSKIGSKHSR
jgi:AraC family transcriptional regulator